MIVIPSYSRNWHEHSSFSSAYSSFKIKCFKKECFVMKWKKSTVFCRLYWNQFLSSSSCFRKHLEIKVLKFKAFLCIKLSCLLFF